MCPTCGQPMPKSGLLGRTELLALLRDGVPHREVYRGQDGGWWVTYGGGEADPRAVVYLIEQKYLSSVYSNIPGEVYHIGKTFDCDATLERRKREGRKAPPVYVE